MSLNRFLQFLVPKDKIFFPLFHKHAKILVEIAETIHEAVNIKEPDERDAYFKRITKLEDRSEEMTRRIYFELSKNFLTPFDREDIYSLVKRMNEVTDFIEAAANRMKLYQVEKVKKSIRNMTEMILEACLNIQKAIKALEGFKDQKTVIRCCARIDKIENKVDHIYDKEVYKIFDEYEDVKEIIKYKEVLSALEDAADKCKNVADILEEISVKHT